MDIYEVIVDKSVDLFLQAEALDNAMDEKLIKDGLSCYSCTVAPVNAPLESNQPQFYKYELNQLQVLIEGNENPGGTKSKPGGIQLCLMMIVGLILGLVLGYLFNTWNLPEYQEITQPCDCWSNIKTF